MSKIHRIEMLGSVRFILFLCILMSSCNKGEITKISIDTDSYLQITLPRGFILNDQINSSRSLKAKISIEKDKSEMRFFKLPASIQRVGPTDELEKAHKVIFSKHLKNSVEDTFSLKRVKNHLVYAEITDNRGKNHSPKKKDFPFALVGVVKGTQGIMSFVYLHNSKETDEYISVIDLLDQSNIVKK